VTCWYFYSRAYDPSAFKTWASKGACPGIPAVLELFATLQAKGFKVFLLSGRDEETLATCTSENLESEGFLGYERLIMRCDHISVLVPCCENFTLVKNVLWHV
jgi:predicted secreted acid phosphatase